ncbi:MAG: preprotein translocase subunit SecA, partial [Leptospiraceae bacterium]|nr:preprotein translocase subunit SecA [Leptospiraceae bacterium]
HLMRIFGGERIKKVMGRLMGDDEELEAAMVDRAIQRAQKRVEGHNFDIRKHLLEYDEVMNRQRVYVYAERDRILNNEAVREHLLSWIEEAIESRVVDFCESNDFTRWDLDGLIEWLASGLALHLRFDPEDFRRSRNPQLEIFEQIWEAARKTYQQKAELVGDENFNYVERRIALDVIDARWKEHLYVMDQLREGVWAQGIAEKNPLVEFKLQGFQQFDQMVVQIKEQITEFLFRVQLEGPIEHTAAERSDGVASHDSMSGFDQTQTGSPNPALNMQPVHIRGLGQARNQGAVDQNQSSSGGASKRRGSRKRRR